jgi:hypothetical protein
VGVISSLAAGDLSDGSSRRAVGIEVSTVTTGVVALVCIPLPDMA